MLQLNLAKESDYATRMSATPGWDAHQTQIVSKEPALAQLLKVLTLLIIYVVMKSSGYMLVGELMDKQYTMVMW